MKTETQIELKDLKIKRVEVPIIGISPLIVHKFSQKSMKEIEDKKMGKAKSAKHAITNPEEEYQAAKHISEEGWEGFPATGIKKCLVRGAKAIGLVMTDVRAGVFVEPNCPNTDLVQLFGESNIRKDHVRPNSGGADIRYRPEYKEWEMVLSITYNEGLVSLDQVFQMIYAGGYGTGLGDWRPEKGGNLGRFTLKNLSDIEK